MVNDKCRRCGRALIDFRTTFDWKKRRLHKSCWKKIQDELSLKIMMEQIFSIEEKGGD